MEPHPEAPRSQQNVFDEGQDCSELCKFRVPLTGKMSVAFLKIPPNLLISASSPIKSVSTRLDTGFRSLRCESAKCTCNRGSLIKLDRIHSPPNKSTKPGEAERLWKPSDTDLESSNKGSIGTKVAGRKGKSVKIGKTLAFGPKRRRRLKRLKRVRVGTNSTQDTTTNTEHSPILISSPRDHKSPSRVKPAPKSSHSIDKIQTIATQTASTPCGAGHPFNAEGFVKPTFDKCVDTSDIGDDSSSSIPANELNILGHLSEAESLLKAERECRFTAIRREYSLVRDRIEAKFHLVVGVCSRRELGLNARYLETLEALAERAPALSLPKLGGITSALNFL